MRKAFTLVELLGVIVVLGMIALIVFPNISKAIRNSKENLYKEQVNLIQNSAARWGADHADSLNEYAATKIPLIDLINGGYISDKTIKDPRTNEEMDGCIVVGFDDGYNQYEYTYYNQDCSEITITTSPNCFTFDSSTGTITDYSDTCPKDVVIPETIGGVEVTSIGDSTFYNKGIATIEIPNSIIRIGSRSLQLNQITNVSIPLSVTEISSHAFESNKLTNVIIPDSVTTIGEAAFAQNELTTLTLGNALTTIEGHAFESNKLTNVIIPDSVTIIGAAAFAQNELTTLTLGNALTTIESHAFESNGLTSLDLPNNVTSIGQSAFSGNQLTEVTISTGLTEIEDRVFYSNQLTNVTIPSNIMSLGLNSFLYNQLTSVTIEGKSSSSEFTNYQPGWGWASGYSDSNITWNG